MGLALLGRGGSSKGKWDALGRRSLSRETGMPVVMICPAEHKTTATHRLDHSDRTRVLLHRSGKVNR